jgi:disulfide bond formation protein DsbB
MPQMTKRLFFLGIFIICATLLGFGYFLQFVKGLEPCPLCIFQRIAYIAIMMVAVIASIHGPSGLWTKLYSSLILVGAVVGAVIAGRQVWLQHMPADQVPACGPGLDFMLDVFPLTETLRMVFTGSGECAEVQWTFLSFSIAEWSLFWFVSFAIAALLYFLNKFPLVKSDK